MADARSSDSFGELLRDFRRRCGLSQERLAERAALSAAAISALELGRRRQPHPRTVSALADALGLASAERASLRRAAGDGARGSSAVPAHRVRPVSTLPAPATPLIDREAELATARRLLDPSQAGVRLLTLVGPGGAGKTRVALAVASALEDAFADGVRFVDLARLRDCGLVEPAIADALGLRGSATQRLEHLKARRLLLVLDTFEHLHDASALLSSILATCPRVAILVTSRAVLHLRAERRVPIGPLGLPSEDVSSLAEIAAAPAVRLFEQRAQAALFEFELDEANAPSVAAICRGLDGLPLAIELAAAQCAVVPPQALLRRLDWRLSLSAHGDGDLPERQRSLRASLAWSYELLGPIEQAVFRRLGTFAGGWTVQAAEAVGGAAEVVGALLDSSLVYPITGADGQPGFAMREFVREYALELLAVSPTAAPSGRRRAL